MAMRILLESAQWLGARRLVPIASAHIDGCLYHGDGGVEFAERLVELGGQVVVPTTLNVGALDLLHPDLVRLPPARRDMARRQMEAYQQMGCRPTWTCAPYQAGHRPRLGEHVAWGESNAVVFANSVLGARTNRYGDFLDICCALTGRAPAVGLHLDEHRHGTVVVDLAALPQRLVDSDVLYPVLGSWLGEMVGDRVAVVDGAPHDLSEDRLKALGAAAASTGSVALVHVVGVTPEAPTMAAALGGLEPERRIVPTLNDMRAARDGLSTSAAPRITAVAVGSPHFSLAEFRHLERLLDGRRLAVPCYACTGRGVYQVLEDQGRTDELRAAGVQFIVDTCVVVTPILPGSAGVLMTNSGKFAHYTPPNTGYGVVFGSLEECVASGLTGRVIRDATLWGEEMSTS
jgi:hypothetical protein